MMDMRLTASYFGGRDYVKTNIRLGVARNRGGTRILSLTSDFLIGLRNALVFECGKAADVVMKSAGKKWGKSFATRLTKELGSFYGIPLDEMPLSTFIACLVESFNVHGLGRLSVDISLFDKGLLVCTLENPIYAGLVENSGQPVDTLMAGILAGLFSQLAGRELDCVQTQCQNCGAPDSRFVISLEDRLALVEKWRNEGRPHAELVAAIAQTRA